MKKYLLVTVLIVAILTVTLVGCLKPETEEIVIGMPDGAPALAFAELIATAPVFENTKASVRYDLVTGKTAAVTVGAKVTAPDNEYDLAILPSNTAANLISGGINIKILGTATWGNLYIIGKDGPIQLSALNGKTVSTINTDGIPYELFKYLLGKSGLSIAEAETPAENEVILEAKEVAQIIQGINGGTMEYAIVAEPALTNVLSKTSTKGWGIVYDFQAAYSAISGVEGGYPQAVLVAKDSFIKNNNKFVAELLTKMATNETFLTTQENIDLAIAAAKKLADNTAIASVKVDTVARSSVRFSPSADCKAQVIAFLAALGHTVTEESFAIVG